MRFGLLALSIAMLSSGGLAAQSVLAISSEATAGVALAPRLVQPATGADYGSMQFAGNGDQRLRLAMR